MNRRVVAVLGAVLVILSLGCGNFKGNGKQDGKEPAPGKTAFSEADCEKPYFVFSAWVDNLTLPKGDFYAVRTLHITVTGTDAEENALEFTDKKTGKKTTFVTSLQPVTGTQKKYSVCMEYGGLPIAHFVFNTLVVNPSEGDTLYVHIRRDDEDIMANHCIPEHADTLERGGKRFLSVSCLVTVAGI